MATIPSSRTSRASNVYDLIKNEDYDARIVRFIGLGIQDQPAYEGVAKEPAFKCSIQFELIGVDATGKSSDGKPLEPRPACQFKEYYLFPGAKRGNVFDLCRAIDPSIESVPRDLDFFTKTILGKVVNVKVGSYVGKDGVTRNKVSAVTPIPTKYQAGIGAARCELVGFDPYEDNDDMRVAYAKLFKFQREILEKAHDASNIPLAGTEPMNLGEEKNPYGSTPETTSSTEKTQTRPAYDEDMGDDDEAPF